MNNLNFDNIFKDFELREMLEKTKAPLSTQHEFTDMEQMDKITQTLPFINDTIRTNIKLGIKIYKQLFNLDRNYIHKIIDEKSTSIDK